MNTLMLMTALAVDVTFPMPSRRTTNQRKVRHQRRQRKAAGDRHAFARAG